MKTTTAKFGFLLRKNNHNPQFIGFLFVLKLNTTKQGTLLVKWQPYEWRIIIPIDATFRQFHKILYLYDFGDEWEHEIFVNSIINDYDKNYPVCLEGEKNAPPEDAGGVSGYEEFLEIMSNPEHTEYKNTRQWAQSQCYKDLDIDLVN